MLEPLQRYLDPPTPITGPEAMIAHLRALQARGRNIVISEMGHA